MIDDILLWMDVPDEDWRRRLVLDYGLYVPSGYWQRAQEGYVWWRQMYVVAESCSSVGENGPRYEDQKKVISMINHWPNRMFGGPVAEFYDDVTGGTVLTRSLIAGSPEAIKAWSPENMREYARSMLRKEREVTESRRPPVLVGQVWAWKSASGPQMISSSSQRLPEDEPCILLHGPRAPWYGPWGRFTDLTGPDIHDISSEPKGGA